MKNLFTPRIGGKVPVWVVIVAVVVIAVVLVIVLTGIPREAGSPEEALKLYEKSMKGDYKAGWLLMPPSEREKTTFGDYQAMRKQADDNAEMDVTKLEYQDYVKGNYHYGHYEYDFPENAEEIGTVMYVINYQSKKGASKYAISTSMIVAKIDGKWYKLTPLN